MPYPARAHPPSTRVDVPDGLGVIGVRAHDSFASMLVLHGQPAVVEGADCDGSIGRLAVRAGARAPRPGELHPLRSWLAAPGIVPDPATGHAPPPDPQSLRPLLRLLTPGRYLIRASTMRCQPTDGRAERASWCYPDAPMLVTTEVWPPPDVELIASYRRRIASGERPAAIALRPHPANDHTLFLLDGHHKVAAYESARVPALLIEIIPQWTPPLSREDLRAHLADPTPFASLLARWPHLDPGQAPT